MRLMKIESTDIRTNYEELTITPSMLIEYTFCPRFVYYMVTLDIPQREENRFKVQKGREIHKNKLRINKDYLRKKLGVVQKQSNVYLVSTKYQIRGVIDEVLSFDDGSMASLDFKYAKYKEVNHKTQKIQALCYTLLIEDVFGKKADKAYIVFTRSKNKVVELTFSERDKKRLNNSIAEVIKIIKTGFYPKRASSRNHCFDCCYKNICEK